MRIHTGLTLVVPLLAGTAAGLNGALQTASRTRGALLGAGGHSGNVSRGGAGGGRPGLSEDAKDELLRVHNFYRCMHQAPAFVWDPVLADSAQSWASSGVFVHSAPRERAIKGEQVGENLAFGFSVPADAIRAWYCEVRCTNPYGLVASVDGPRSNGQRLDHYTQVVWERSTRIGCGGGMAMLGSDEAPFWVCRYAAAGNTAGQFRENVHAPIDDVATCMTSTSDEQLASALLDCPAKYACAEAAPAPAYRGLGRDQVPVPALPSAVRDPVAGPAAVVPAPQVESDWRDMLELHNLYRCVHGVPPLEWDQALEADAQQWADRHTLEGSPGSARPPSGENMAFGYPTSLEAVRSWYCEILCTQPFGAAAPQGDSGTLGQPIGHYTQVVWKDTAKVGCGRSRMEAGGRRGPLWVCRYRGAAGLGGGYAANVLPPSRDIASCPSYALLTMADSCPVNPACPTPTNPVPASPAAPAALTPPAPAPAPTPLAAVSTPMLVPGADAAAPTPDMQNMLDLHNVYRCMHNVPSLVWDEGLAASAQAWADRGSFEHSPVATRTIDGQVVGENLAWGQTSTMETMKAWYCEVLCTKPYGRPLTLEAHGSPKAQIAHFTQIVWRDTRRVGCARSVAPIEGHNDNFWVCQYSPSGNYQNAFRENVRPPTVPARACPTHKFREVAAHCPRNPDCPADLLPASVWDPSAWKVPMQGLLGRFVR